MSLDTIDEELQILFKQEGMLEGFEELSNAMQDDWTALDVLKWMQKKIKEIEI